MERREFLKAAAALSAATLTPVAYSDPIREGLKTSDLVYLSPYKSNGELSRCQAEIWFVYDGADILVCTNTDSWRTRAIRQGLTKTQFWVGDLGQWQDTDGRYRDLPQVLGEGSIEADPRALEQTLELFGDKYPLGWVVWGRRFRKGLANGKRTMLRYKLFS
jgi:hypothetical protein